MIFAVFIVVVGLVVVALGVTGFVTLRDRKIKSLEADLKKSQERGAEVWREMNLAHNALRRIVNNAGNPAIEAQIVLDNYNSKEIL